MPRGQRNDLGRALFEAREAAKVRQADAAKAAGFSQNKISRVEYDQGHLLKPGEATVLLDLYGVRGDEQERIMTMIEAERTQHIDARVILQKGAHHFQERFRQLAEGSKQVRSFVPTAVIGYLQTPAYMRVVFTQRQTEEEAAPSIAKRLEQQLLLDDPDRKWSMIQTEGALRWQVGAPVLMADQIDRLATEGIDRPNITFGLIPWHTSVDLLPMTGFHIYDQDAVVVGTWSGTAIIRGASKSATMSGCSTGLRLGPCTGRTLARSYSGSPLSTGSWPNDAGQAAADQLHREPVGCQNVAISVELDF